MSQKKKAKDESPSELPQESWNSGSPAKKPDLQTPTESVVGGVTSDGSPVVGVISHPTLDTIYLDILFELLDRRGLGHRYRAVPADWEQHSKLETMKGVEYIVQSSDVIILLVEEVQADFFWTLSADAVFRAVADKTVVLFCADVPPKEWFDRFDNVYGFTDTSQLISLFNGTVGDTIESIARGEGDAPPSGESNEPLPKRKENEVELTISGQEPTSAVVTRMLSDAPIDGDDGDLLDFGDYADAIAGLIDNPETSTPLTLAINAPWGAGKSSLAALIIERLKNKPAAKGDQPHVVCEFNAWMHDDADNLAASLTAVVAQTANQYRPRWRKFLQPLPIALRQPKDRWRVRVGWIVLLLVLSVAGTSLWPAIETSAPPTNLPASVVAESISDLPGTNSQPKGDSNPSKPGEATTSDALEKKPPAGDSLLERFGALFGSIVVILGLLFTLVTKLLECASAVSGYVKSPADEAVTGSMTAVRTQMGQLIRQATPKGSRFILFLDDVERCRPPKCMDLLEAVNQLLSHPEVVTIVLADLPGVAACAEIKYKDLAEKYTPSVGGSTDGSESGNAFGRMYLQKFIQLQFDLPEQTTQRVRSLAEALTEKPEKPQLTKKKAQALPVFPTWGFNKWVASRVGFAWSARRRTLFQGLVRLSNAPRVTKAPIRFLFALCWGVTRNIVATIAAPAWLAAAYGVRARYPVRERNWTGGTRLESPWLNLTGLMPIALFTLSLVILIYQEIYRYTGGWSSPDIVSILGSSIGDDAPAIVRAALSLLLLPSILVASPPDRLFFVASPSAYMTLTFLFFAFVAQFQRSADSRHLAGARHTLDQELEKGESVRATGIAEGMGISEEQAQKLVDERRGLSLVNKSDFFVEARETMVGGLPPVPRSVKRALNRMRLFISILFHRGLLEDGSIEGKHVGKWVALQERWPEVAQRIIRNPESFAEIEEAAQKAGVSPSDYKETVKAHLPGSEDDPTLETFLAREPFLGTVLPRLTSFVADEPDAPAGPAN